MPDKTMPKFTPGYFAAFSVIEAILGFMERKSRSRADLARLAEVSRATVTKWLAPGRNLSFFTAGMIVHALGGELKFEIVDREQSQQAMTSTPAACTASAMTTVKEMPTLRPPPNPDHAISCGVVTGSASYSNARKLRAVEQAAGTVYPLAPPALAP